jgi:hypothetical protein
VPGWESNFAQTFRPDAKTLVGLATEHKRLTRESQSYIAAEVRGNAKLTRLRRENLQSLFPDVGFSESTGEPLRRLRKGTRSVLQIFGVGDGANLIRLLIKGPRNDAFYW